MKLNLRLLILSLFLALGAKADLGTTVSITSPAAYTPGTTTTVTASVTINSTTTEYADAIEFIAPGGVTITAVTASGSGACASNAGVQATGISTPGSIGWVTSGYAYPAPSGCGAYANGTYSLDFDLVIPAGFTGPLQITWNAYGDGWNCAGACSCGGYTCDNGTVNILQALPCKDPDSLDAQNVMATSANLIWVDTATPQAGAYDVFVQAAGAGIPVGTPAGTDIGVTSPFAKTGLPVSSNLEFWVRSDCSGAGNGQGNWTGPFAFTTPASCIIPTALNAFNVTTMDAELTWTENNTPPPALGWEVAIGGAGGGLGSTIKYISANDTVTASVAAGFTLPPNTPFEFYVRAICGAGDSSLWAGPFNFTTLSTCLPPDTLNAQNITGTTADLSWVDMAASPPMGWEIINQLTTGPVAGDTTYQAGATPTSLTVTGLTPNNTNYEFYVRAVCAPGDTSVWTGPFAYSTVCVPFNAPYCENFESNTGVCWTQETATDDFNWTRNSGTTTSSLTGPSSGANGTTWYMYTETSSPRVAGEVAIYYSPEIDLTALTTPQLNFWLHMYGPGMNPDGNVAVDVTTVGSGTWSNVLTVTGNQGNVWTNHKIQLPGVAGDTVQFRITGTISTAPPAGTFVYENDFAFDEFCVEEATTCFVPDSLDAQNIMANSADLSWVDTSGATIQGWEIINQLTTGPVAGDTTYQAGATPTSLSVSSLIALSNYEFYVRAVCGPGDTSAWAGPYAYSTPPSCFLPDSLDAQNITPTSADLSWVDTAGVPVTGWEIRNQLTSGPVAGDTTYQAGATPTSLSLSTLTPNSNYVFYVRTVCGAGDTSLWAGPFAYSTPPTCIAPDTLDAQNITSTTADLSWVDMAAAPPMGWEIINQLTSGPVAGDTTYQAGATPTSISMASLTPNSNYEFYVRAVCTVGDSSAWSGPYAYSTPPTCVVPDTLNATNITSTSADLSWVDMTPAAPAPMGWEIINQLTSGPVAGDTTYQAGAAPTSITISTLTAGSNYEFYVRAVCSASDSSAWAGPFAYSTTCTVPNMLGTTNLTPTSVDLNWSAIPATTMPMGWEIIHQLATGPVAGDTTYQAGAMPTSLSLSTLTPNTNYQFFVRAVCSAGDSSGWAGPFNYSTPCVPVMAPYCENFDAAAVGVASIPCWNNYSENSASSTDFWQIQTSGGPGPDYTVLGAVDHTSGSGNFAWVDYSNIDPVNGAAVFETPLVDVSALTTPRLILWILSNNGNDPGNNNTLTVDVWDGAAWNNALVTYAADNANWVPIVVDLSALTITGPVQARIKASSTATVNDFWNDILIDDVCIEETPTCFVPDSLNAMNMTTTSVDLSWVDTAGVTVQGWEIINQLISGPQPGDTTYQAGATPTSISLSSLVPGGQYEFYVRAVCGSGDSSAWGGPYAYNLVPICFVPDTLDAQNITSNSADLSWVDTASTPPQGWMIINSLVSGPQPGDTTYQAGPTPTSLSVSSLVAGSAYQFSVRAVCGPGDSSAWSPAFVYNTLVGCGGFVYDDGGATGTYGLNRNDTVTICPDNVGDVVSLTFTEFTFENRTGGGDGCWDGVTLYNGNSPAAPVISSPSGLGDRWCWDRDDAIPSGTGDLQDATVVSTSADGCLTMLITTDGSVVRNGLSAIVTCAPPAGPYDVVPQSAGTVTSDSLVIDGEGWFHYLNASATPTQILLSTRPAGTNAQVPNIGAVSEVTGAGAVDLSTAPYVTNPLGWHVMNRTWDVAPSNQPNTDVPVRYYYTTDDYNDMVAVPSSSVTAHTDLHMYKVNNGKDELLANGHTSVLPADYQQYDGGAATPSASDWVYNTYGSGHQAEFWVQEFSGGGGGGNFNGAGALPVDLTEFTVTKEGNVSLAAWITASERNNSHFNLQRSLDGAEFTTLGRVNTKAVNGTSDIELTYDYTDKAPQIGHNYYRLEQVDIDGQITYSAIIDVVWGSDGSIVSIYPNPATDKLNVDLTSDKVSQLEVRLMDMSGRVVKSVMQQTDKGLTNVTLNLSDIASGVYNVQIIENNRLIHNSKVSKRD